MWLIAMLLVIGCFLLLPVLGLIFPVLLIEMPLLFLFHRPSVQVYTRTFPNPDPAKSAPEKSKSSSLKQKILPDVIDVDFTEHDI